MVANAERRGLIVDTALALLGGGGSRAVSHRGIDRAAGLPLGTTANYFPTRAELVRACAERIFERLAPDPDRVAEIRASYSGHTAVEEFTLDVVRRLAAVPALTAALFELRLEAGRTPEVAAVLNPFLRTGFEEDVRFHRAAGLPGGRTEVGLLHQAVNGLLLEFLGGQRPAEELEPATRELVQRLIPEELVR
ncbi:TetR family transcriptional regulator [Enemella evansiae]|uniref:TetR/AcrR family transcriptional regulator n=1 Tax=Enemella evansiae TaxID=2016499 RepID=UPI000B96EBC6|nr:TetR/AcrR family transcriptional regulator [Enemella evansiae]OYO12151.1 TetR family transcriptional regulator [Enemella evansiae]